MEQSIFKGACTALVTPFHNNRIDFKMVEKLIIRQINAGIHTIILAGTTGESPTLSDQEKQELFKFCKDVTGDACNIIAGTGSNSTVNAVRLSIMAEEAGADGLLVVSPYYNKANTHGLYVHYWTIAQNVSIPILIYNVPSRTGVDIPVSVYEELSKLSNIAGVKEASVDIRKISKIIDRCGSDFTVLSGNDDMIVPVMALGGKGVVSVLSNLYPRETAAVCDAALAGNYKLASHLQIKMLPKIEALFCEVNPIPVKYAMKLIGLDCGDCRLPLTELTSEHKKLLEKVLQ